MLLSFLLFLHAFECSAHMHLHKWRAYFDSTNTSFVELSGTSITMAISNPNELSGLTEVSWHIHEMWSANVSFGSSADICGAGATGGHWDPTAACSGASGNPNCDNKGGCVNSTYDCSPTSYQEERFNCEAGDMSGKFGKLSLTNGVGSASYTDSYYPYPLGEGRSIVFHGVDGARVLCGKLIMMDGTPTVSTQKQSRNLDTNLFNGFAEVKMTFNSPGNEKTEISAALDFNKMPAGVSLPAGCTDPGSEIAWHIHAHWSAMDYSIAFDDWCGAMWTENHVDPGKACGPASNNEFCNATLYPGCDFGTYDCTSTSYGDDPFACEVGDLSGKFGKLVVGDDMTASATGLMDAYLDYESVLGIMGLVDPPTSSIVFHCPGAERAFCIRVGAGSQDSTDIIYEYNAGSTTAPYIVNIALMMTVLIFTFF